MTHFVKVNGATPVTKVDMHGENRMRLHLVDAGGEKKNIVIKSTNAAIVTAKLVALYDGPKGIWSVDLISTKIGKTEIDVKINGKDAVKLSVNVVEKIALPAPNTNEGLLARLFLSENRTPGQSGYDAGKVKQGMEWMRLVIENRLKNNPKQFGAAGAKTIQEIVKAKGQFAGFESYPSLDAKVLGRIIEILKIANNDNDARQSSYIDFVNKTLSVANAKAVIKDPSPNGLYGWRTEGHGSPGSRFEKYKSAISGNQFYTLKKEK